MLFALCWSLHEDTTAKLDACWQSSRLGPINLLCDRSPSACRVTDFESKLEPCWRRLQCVSVCISSNYGHDLRH